jgi:hypothetical protein
MDGSPGDNKHIISDLAVKEFVEDMGLIFEETGHTRMAGKIFGSLLVCSPPYLSATELSEATGGSKASISTITRQMILSGLLERVGIPGKKTVYYRIKERHLIGLIKQRLEIGGKVKNLMLQGMNLVAGIDTKQYKRMEDLYDLYDFVDKELPVLIEKWKKQRNILTPAD